MWREPLDIFDLGLGLTVAQVLMLVAIVALLLGWGLAYLTGRRRAIGPEEIDYTKDRLTSNAAFMKGIDHILSDRPEQAIEELTRAVSVDTETVQTYVALGNLFRRQGDLDRAIRIRQSIIVRPNLDPKIRQQACFDLGLDYRRGGFLDLAAKTFEELLKENPRWVEAYQELAQVYEETRQWDQAAQAREKAAKLSGRPAGPILAHYQVEIGRQAAEQGLVSKAKSAFKKAMALDRRCVEAYLQLGDLHLNQGRSKKALAAWRRVLEVAPELTYLTFSRLGRLAAGLKDLTPVREFLEESATVFNDPLTYLALARLMLERGQTEGAREWLQKALELDPGLIEAQRELGRLTLNSGRPDEVRRVFKLILESLPDTEVVFQCRRCGLESRQLMWRCPRCYTWGAVTPRRQSLGPPTPSLLAAPTLPIPGSRPAAPDQNAGASTDSTASPASPNAAIRKAN